MLVLSQTMERYESEETDTAYMRGNDATGSGNAGLRQHIVRGNGNSVKVLLRGLAQRWLHYVAGELVPEEERA